MFSSANEALAALASGDPEHRQAAVVYLGENPSLQACQALVAALGDSHRAVQQALTHALLQQTAPERIPLLVQNLQESNPYQRNAALSVLIEISQANPEAPRQALRHALPEVRQWAADALGDLDFPNTAPALIERLDDPAELPNVRRAAAQALGKLGQAEAVPALLAAAAQGDFWVRHAAIDALSRLADERAVEPLCALMQQDPGTRPAIIRALGNIGHDSAVPELVGALDDPNDSARAASLEALFKIVVEPTGRRLGTQRTARLRPTIPLEPLRRELNTRLVPSSAYAAHLLGWLGRPEALPDLIEALDSVDEPIRDAATEALLRFGPNALPGLLTALARPELNLRERAVELIGLVGDRAVAPALVEYLHEPQLSLRLAVLRALGTLGGEAAYVGLLQALTDPATRDTALGILGTLSDGALIEDLKAYLQRYLYADKNHGSLRWAAAQALSLLGDEIAVSILLNAIRLPDEAIRLPAAEALARVHGRRAVNVLIEALGDRDWLVRQKAAEALSHIADSRVVAALLPLTHDPEWRVRWALVAALGRITDSRIYAPLRELAQDKDRWVRRSVMEVCARLEDSRATEIGVRGLQDPDADVRLAALLALQTQRDPALAAPVAALIHDRVPAVRQAAVRALGLVAGVLAMDSLALLAHDPEESVRAEVATVLGELGFEEGLTALEILLQDSAEAIRRRAGEALAHIGTLNAGEVLADALTQAADRADVQARLISMGEIGLRVLLSAARSADAGMRAAAAEVLGQAGQPYALPTLRQMLRDPDQRVRKAAEAALINLK